MSGGGGAAAAPSAAGPSAPLSPRPSRSGTSAPPTSGGAAITATPPGYSGAVLGSEYALVLTPPESTGAVRGQLSDAEAYAIGAAWDTSPIINAVDTVFLNLTSDMGNRSSAVAWNRVLRRMLGRPRPRPGPAQLL